MFSVLSAVTITIFLSLVHFVGDRFAKKIEKFHEELLNFSSGFFLSFILLHFFPILFQGFQFFHNWVFFGFLSGVCFFHVLEKFLYQHVDNKKQLMKKLSELHVFGFLVDNFIVGIVVALFLNSPHEIPILILLPLLLHTLSSALSLSHISESYDQNPIIQLALYLSPFLGLLFGMVVDALTFEYYLVFGFVSGILFYVCLRDMLPNGKVGNPWIFVGGVFLTFVIYSIV